MNKKLLVILSLVLLVMMLSLTGCGGSDQGESEGKSTGEKQQSSENKVDEVVVGVLYPTSGNLARLGGAAQDAVKLAAEDINAAGGIKSLGGAKIKLEITDPGSTPESTKSASERLIQTKQVSALTGDYSSSLSMVTSEIAERAKIPFVTASISDGLSSRGFKYFFQVSPKGSMFGETQVRFAKESLVDDMGIQPKAAIIFEDTTYGSSTAEGLKKTAEELGFDIVLNEPYQAGFTDATPLINKIKGSGATILFPVSYLTDAILIQKTIKLMGVDIITVGGGAGYLMPEFRDALGADADGVVSVASWNKDVNKPGIEDVAARYKEKYGEFLTEHSGEAYAATWVIAHGIEKAASTDPTAIRDAIAELIVEDGMAGGIMPGGNIEFDETGWNKNVHPVIIQWQDGEPKTIYPAQDATSEFRN